MEIKLNRSELSFLIDKSAIRLLHIKDISPSSGVLITVAFRNRVVHSDEFSWTLAVPIVLFRVFASTGELFRSRLLGGFSSWRLSQESLDCVSVI